MDNFTSGQIRSYEKILNKIETEHVKLEKLKENIEKVNNEIKFTKLSSTRIKPSTAQKLGHINVKIFSELLELFNLYNNEIAENLTTFSKFENNFNFYMIEIIIPQIILKQFETLDCSLIVTIAYTNNCISKIIKLINFHQTTPLICVLPIDKKIINSKVCAMLQLNSILLPLDDVTVDISYFFEIIKKKRKNLSTEKIIVEISKSHNSTNNSSINNLINNNKANFIEYHFQTKLNYQDFIKLFIQHCYHKMDLELFTELMNSDSKNKFTIKFSTGIAKKHNIIIDKAFNVITISANNIVDLILLKEYFCNENTLAIKNERKINENLKKLKLSLNQCNNNNEEELRKIYHDLRKVWIN